MLILKRYELYCSKILIHYLIYAVTGAPPNMTFYLQKKFWFVRNIYKLYKKNYICKLQYTNIFLKLKKSEWIIKDQGVPPPPLFVDHVKNEFKIKSLITLPPPHTHTHKHTPLWFRIFLLWGSCFLWMSLPQPFPFSKTMLDAIMY